MPKSNTRTEEERINDAQEIATKWGGQDQVIVIGIDDKGHMTMATYGKDQRLCGCAKLLGNVAFDAIVEYVTNVIAINGMKGD